MFGKKGPAAFVRCDILVLDKVSGEIAGCFVGKTEAEAIRAACAALLESPVVKSFPDDFEVIVHTFQIPDDRRPLTYLGEVFNPAHGIN